MNSKTIPRYHKTKYVALGFLFQKRVRNMLGSRFGSSDGADGPTLVSFYMKYSASSLDSAWGMNYGQQLLQITQTIEEYLPY
jgi:hypothetical protein